MKLGKNVLYFFIAIITSGLLLYWVFEEIGTEKIWNSLISFSPAGIVWVLVFSLLYVLAAVFRWRSILKDKGYSLSLKKVTSSWLGGFGISYFSPFALLGGEAFRAYYLKERNWVPWKTGIISIFIDKVLDGAFFFLLIILGVAFFLLSTFSVPFKLWLVLLILLFPVIGMVFFYSRAFKNKSILRSIEKPFNKLAQNQLPNEALDWEKELFIFFRSGNKQMWKAVAFSLLRAAIMWWRVWIIVWFLGLEINGFLALSIIAFTNISYLLPLPAALGSHEAVQAFAFTSLGFAAQNSVAFTLILRAFDIIIAGAGILVVFRFVIKWLKTRTAEEK